MYLSSRRAAIEKQIESSNVLIDRLYRGFHAARPLAAAGMTCINLSVGGKIRTLQI
jgi:hypothetical protein